MMDSKGPHSKVSIPKSVDFGRRAADCGVSGQDPGPRIPQRRGRLNAEFVEEPPGVVNVRRVSFRRPVRYSASVRRAHSRSAPAAKPPKGRQRLDLTRPLS